MSYLKFNPNLFLEVAELNRFKKFLDDEGFRRLLLLNTKSFGIFPTSGGNNFKVEEGSLAGTIKLANVSYALDSTGKLIVKQPIDNINVTSGTWYWVIVKHEYLILEEGTVSVGVDGLLTGVSTKFTEVLRGQPNFPAKIKLWKSRTEPALNSSEYEVLTVSGDTLVALQGDFSAESNLFYSVVGTFTPGFIVPAGSKDIFQYDDCIGWSELEGGFIDAGTGADPTPYSLSSDEYVIAAIKSDSVTVEIRDYRMDNLYETRADFNLKKVLSSTNYLLGISEIMYSHYNTGSSNSLVKMEWAFLGSVFSLVPSGRQIIVTVGSGGKIKSVGDHYDNYFTGWRVYAEGSGTPLKILTSVRGVGGTSIILNMEDYDYEVLASANSLLITPDADEIEIKCEAATSGMSTYPNSTKYFRFPINQEYGFCELSIIENPYIDYYFSYRNITNGEYTTANNDWQLISSDSAYGYYAEDQHDYEGRLVGSPTRTSYNITGGKIHLADNPASVGLHGITTGLFESLNYTNNMDGAKEYILVKPGQYSFMFDGELQNFTLKGIKLTGYHTDIPPVGTEIMIMFVNMGASSVLSMVGSTASANGFVYPGFLLETTAGKIDLSEPGILSSTGYSLALFTFKFFGEGPVGYYKWWIKDWTSFLDYGYKPKSSGFSYPPGEFVASTPTPYVFMEGLRCHLEGCISASVGTATSSAYLIATLPANSGILKYRPTRSVYCNGLMYSSFSGDTKWVSIPLRIDSDGKIYIIGTTDNNTTWFTGSLIYLDGISYSNTI